MKLKQAIERYWYIFLVLIILFTLFFQTKPEITSEVILDLHNLNGSYELENPSKIKINTTISENNLITGSVILEPNSSLKLLDKDFIAIGEEYEE